MSREEELIQRCKWLEQRVELYEAELQKRNTELAQLKRIVKSLVTKHGLVKPPSGQVHESPVAAPQKQAPPPPPLEPEKVAAAPTALSEESTEPAIVGAGMELNGGEAVDEPEAAEATEAEAVEADAAACLVVPLPGSGPCPSATGPDVLVPYDFKPGRFMSAVLEGESEEEAAELREQMGQFLSCPEEEHFRVLQRMSTSHRLLTSKMAGRMDPDLAWEKRLFIRYGMLDETLMPDRMHVWEALWNDKSRPEDTGIYFLDEWLDAVGSGSIPVSSADEATLGGEKQDREATGEKALYYETQSTQQMQRMSVGPRGNKVTILYQSYCFPGPDNPVINRRWLGEAMNYIRKCDTTLFGRHYKGEDVEVEPLFFVAPGYGDRGVCWEPYSPGHKGNTGPRLCLCAFPPRGSMKAVIMSLGDYRWEYAKADARQYWMVEGLTGDWLSLFKIKEQRLDLKAIFVNAYIQWVLKESQRIPVLERRFREFLWRKCPFNEEIKQNIRGSGVFLRLFELDDRLKERDERDKELAAKARRTGR